MNRLLRHFHHRLHWPMWTASDRGANIRPPEMHQSQMQKFCFSLIMRRQFSSMHCLLQSNASACAVIPQNTDGKRRHQSAETSSVRNECKRRQDRPYQRWDPEEIQRLKRAVEEYGDWDWVRVAIAVQSRTAIQCQLKWKRSLKPGIRLGKWTPAEDRLLVEVIQREMLAARESGVAVDKSLTCQHADLLDKLIRTQTPGDFLMENIGNSRENDEDKETDAESPPLSAMELSKIRRGFWTDIASSLATGRSSYQCFVRFDQLTARKYANKPWTIEEMDRLRRVVGQVESNLAINTTSRRGRNRRTESEKWRLVAEQMPGRTKSMCMRRWNQVGAGSHELSSNLSASDPQASNHYHHWTEEECKKLEQAVEQFGTSRWAIVALQVGTRNSVQCIQKWKLSYGEGIKKGTWSPEETEKLLELAKKYDDNLLRITSAVDTHMPKFRWIAKHLRNRSASQCRSRLQYLKFKETSKINWTEEEIRELTGIVSKLDRPWSGGVWMAVSKLLGGKRTASDYRLKWREIMQNNLFDHHR